MIEFCPHQVGKIDLQNSFANLYTIAHAFFSELSWLLLRAKLFNLHYL